MRQQKKEGNKKNSYLTYLRSIIKLRFSIKTGDTLCSHEILGCSSLHSFSSARA
jgi:hypothetical protein